MTGICAAGEGFIGMNDNRQCSACPLNSYNNDQGSICTPCKEGYDTNGMTGATQCNSKYFMYIIYNVYKYLS